MAAVTSATTAKGVVAVEPFMARAALDEEALQDIPPRGGKELEQLQEVDAHMQEKCATVAARWREAATKAPPSRKLEEAFTACAEALGHYPYPTARCREATEALMSTRTLPDLHEFSWQVTQPIGRLQHTHADAMRRTKVAGAEAQNMAEVVSWTRAAEAAAEMIKSTAEAGVKGELMAMLFAWHIAIQHTADFWIAVKATKASWSWAMFKPGTFASQLACIQDEMHKFATWRSDYSSRFNRLLAQAIQAADPTRLTSLFEYRKKALGKLSKPEIHAELLSFQGGLKAALMEVARKSNTTALTTFLQTAPSDIARKALSDTLADITDGTLLHDIFFQTALQDAVLRSLLVTAPCTAATSALIAAAHKGSTETLSLLLLAGARPEVALGVAAREGHLVLVQALIGLGAKPFALDSEQMTPLVHAARGGHGAVIRYCLRFREGISSEEVSIRQAFWAGASGGHIETLELLMTVGASLETSDEHGKTALTRAVEDGHEAAVRWLLDRGANIEARDSQGDTPLMLAASRGHLSTLQILVLKKASLEAKDSKNNTALTRALLAQRSEVAEFLINQGADVSIRNEEGHTPLTLTLRYQLRNILILLVKKDQAGVRSFLKNALERGCPREDINFLFSGYPHEADRQVFRTLAYESVKETILAICLPNEEVLRCLVVLGGIDLNHLDKDRTLLMHVVTLKRGENRLRCDMIRVLHAAGAQLDLQNLSEGMTTLMLSVEDDLGVGDELNTIRTLLELRADKEITDHHDHTALMLAVQKQHKQAVKELLLGGASLKIQDTEEYIEKDSALTLAAIHGDLEIFTRLLNDLLSPQSRIPLPIVNREVYRSLRCAAQSGHLEIVNALIILHSNHRVDISDSGGSSPMTTLCLTKYRNENSLFLAAMKGHSAVVSVLLKTEALPMNKEVQRVEDNFTPLMGAIEGWNAATTPEGKERAVATVAVLLSGGVDINTRAKAYTPLSLASAYGSLEIVELLLSTGGASLERWTIDQGGCSAFKRALIANPKHVKVAAVLCGHPETIVSQAFGSLADALIPNSLQDVVRAITEAMEAVARAATRARGLFRRGS